MRDVPALFDKPAVNSNVMVYHWTQHASDRQLSPTMVMIGKYIKTCVLCKEERNCGECCVLCARTSSGGSCPQRIKCPYVLDIIYSMGLLLDSEQMDEVYARTASDAIIQARCEYLSAKGVWEWRH